MKTHEVFYLIALVFVAIAILGFDAKDDKRTCLAIAGVFFIAGVIKSSKK